MTCRLSVVVVAYAAEAVVLNSLASVERALAEVGGASEAIVVLNRKMAEIRRRFSKSWIVVEPGRNRGFAGGVMEGLAEAHGEWVALINDDCIVEPQALVEMLAVGASGADVGSVAATILFADREDTINSAGIEVDELGIAHERLLGARSTAGGTEIVDVFGACAAAALYRRAMLDDVHGFDESFFAYLEDADLAWRARMAGWRSLYAPRAVVVHRHSTALGHGSDEKYFLVGRNRIRMLAKNATPRQLLTRGWAMALYDVAYVAYCGATFFSFAPLRGRLRGVTEWRSYRAAGHARRGPVRLGPSPGLGGALRRDRAYRRATRGGTASNSPRVFADNLRWRP